MLRNMPSMSSWSCVRERCSKGSKLLATQMLIRSSMILIIKAEIVMLRKQSTTGLNNYVRKETLESQKLVKRWIEGKNISLKICLLYSLLKVEKLRSLIGHMILGALNLNLLIQWKMK